jgi:hypothetical protein
MPAREKIARYLGVGPTGIERVEAVVEATEEEPEAELRSSGIVSVGDVPWGTRSPTSPPGYQFRWPSEYVF